MVSKSDYGKLFIILGGITFLIGIPIAFVAAGPFMMHAHPSLEDTFMLLGGLVPMGVGGFFGFIGLVMLVLFRKKGAPAPPKEAMPKVPMPKQAAPKIPMPKTAPPPRLPPAP